MRSLMPYNGAFVNGLVFTVSALEWFFAGMRSLVLY